NRIVGLPPPFYLSCFISGLKPAIRREVQAFQPLSLTQAISLAKLQEEKTLDHRPHPQFSKQPSTSTQPNQSFKPTLTVGPPKATPTKRLTPTELQARREKGLCYNCDKKFVTGHRYKRQFNLLIVQPDEDFMEDDTSILTLTACDPKPINSPTPEPDP
ncbi:hypothetical protein A2U01_0016301, partial [Trifolium medium]|nr:hypothetical protein [Trifolium medium]